MMTKNYLFNDSATGEQFVVEAKTKAEAMEIAKEYFEEPEFDSLVSDEYAEWLGVDTY